MWQNVEQFKTRHQTRRVGRADVRVSIPRSSGDNIIDEESIAIGMARRVVWLGSLCDEENRHEA